jgi:hypothetical protein
MFLFDRAKSLGCVGLGLRVDELMVSITKKNEIWVAIPISQRQH